MSNEDRSKMQGEGDYEAGRRYDKATREFVAAVNIEDAAAAAAPKNAAEAAAMAAAEREGLSHAKGAEPGTAGLAEAGNADARGQLWDLVKDIRFAMFTTRHTNGHLHSRPMTTQNAQVDEDTSLWFFMSRASETVADVALDPVVNVSYADPGEDSYVSISGTAAVVEDMAKKKLLWSKLAAAWFPGGADDPDLALIQVKIAHAEYWDVKQSKIVQLLHMATAAITGKPPQNMGEHGEIHMR